MTEERQGVQAGDTLDLIEVLVGGDDLGQPVVVHHGGMAISDTPRPVLQSCPTMNPPFLRYAALPPAVTLAALLILGVLGPGVELPPAVLPVLGLEVVSGNGPDLAGPLCTGAHQDQVSLLVSLEGPTLWELYEASGGGALGEDTNAPPVHRHPLSPSTSNSLRDAITRRQDMALMAIQNTGAVVVDAYQVVHNGFLVHARADQMAAIARMPSVVAVSRMPILEPDLADAVPYIGATQVREELGFDGRDVTVAVVDTGLDYTHITFGGSGTRTAYYDNDENVVEPGTFPTAKVVGGYDLAGQYYSPDCARLPVPFPQCDTVPHPDDDPLEPYGLAHGTAVASVIAGEGTEKVHAGVAPGASLVALKVYGSPIGAPPRTDLAIGALEWIVAHNMGLEVPGKPPDGKIDVVNLSMGFPWATGLPAIDEAVDAVVRSGATVVASAGDSGPTPFIVGQPGAATLALSVASAYPPGKAEKARGILAEWISGANTVTLGATALEADFTPRLGVTGPITEPLGWYGLACNDEAGNRPPPAQDLTGKIALIERGECTYYDKLWNAAKEKAIAAVVFTNEEEKGVMGCGAPSDCANPPPVPAVMIDREPGLRLRALLEGGTAVTAAMGPELEVEVENLTDTISSFSSRGPSRTGALKPQITAPGSSIFSAIRAGGMSGATHSGTSMATPFVSGVAALVAQRNSEAQLGLDSSDIAAMVMNYADPVVRLENGDSGPPAAVARQGAGRVNAWRSARGTTLVRSNEGIAELGFGHIHVLDDAVQIARRLTVRNLSGEPRTYRAETAIAFADEDAGQGVTVTVRPESLTIGGGDEGRVDVLLHIDPRKLRPWNLRGLSLVNQEAGVQELEIEGFVRITPQDSQGAPLGSETVSVPFHLLPRSHACVTPAVRGPLVFHYTGQVRRLSWTNSCGAEGDVEAFALAGTDPAESAQDPSFPAKLDIDAVGVRFGPIASDPGDFVLEWAIHTRGQRRLPLEAEFYVYLDLDLDGTFDRVVFNRPGRYVIHMPELANRWLVAHAPLIAATLRPDFDQTNTSFFGQRFDLDETTSALQVSAESLGLDFARGDVAFRFAVLAMETAGDHPVTGTFPGQDAAPDGLELGAAFTFDQAALACLSLTGPNGRAAASPVGGLKVGPGESRSVDVQLGCDPRPPTGPAGFLLSYPANLGTEAQAEIRHWQAAGPGSPVYLPYCHLAQD